MTSAISSSAFAQYTSPLTRLQNELASEVSAGTISTGDQSALSSALNDIDSALKSQASSGTAPGDVKSKIDDLIAGEVENGKLTSDQAAELKNVFASTFQNAPQGAGGAGGPPPGGGGPPPGGGAGGAGGSSGSTSTDPADLNKDGVVTDAERAEYGSTHPGAASSSSDSGSSSSSTDSSTDSSDPSKLLADFLKSLQESLGSSSGYSANGTNVVSQLEFQVINYLA
jgi:hypothetical protein